VIIPSNIYFNSIHETDKSILFQTLDEQPKRRTKKATISHVLSMTERNLVETSNPTRNIFDIGMLAGRGQW